MANTSISYLVLQAQLLALEGILIDFNLSVQLTDLVDDLTQICNAVLFNFLSKEVVPV